MIVLDSSFLVAYHNTRDAHHAAAARTMRRFLEGEWGRGLLLEYVFLEVVTVLHARRGRTLAAAVAALLLQASEIDFVPCSDFFVETWEVFRGQRSGKLSFTDAAIASVARAGSEGLVATFDTDFRELHGLLVVPES
jgi:predicted nucleic acid-binding protein